MSLPTIQDYLASQQTINPFAEMALRQATEGAAQTARAQEEAALSQIALNPNIIQQASRPEVATTGQAATTVNVKQPQLRNLGFSQLNALASQTPQVSFSPTDQPGGALAQGISNLFNVREARRSQAALGEILQQQQAAQQAALEQRQQAAQVQAAAAAQKQQDQLTGLQALGYNPQIAAGIVASGQADEMFAGLSAIAEAQGDVGAANVFRGYATGIAPSLADPRQTAPIDPISQRALEIGGGGDFDQFGPTKSFAEAKIDLAEAAAAPVGEQVALEKAKADLEAVELSNQFKPFKEQRERQAAEIQKLTAEGNLQEAAKKEADLAAKDRFLESIAPMIGNATPRELQEYKIIGQMYGIDPKTFDVAESAESKVVKVGKNKYAQQNQAGELELIEPNKLKKKQKQGAIDIFAGPLEVSAPPKGQPVDIGQRRGLVGPSGGFTGGFKPIELGG